MKRIKSLISTIFDGENKAYIYIWFSKSERFLYVGQTNDRFGTLGRAYSHIQTNGTLRMRCNERIGINLELIEDLHLLSYSLPNSNEFISNESSFRLAVEYLVQFGLHEAKKNVNPSFRIISNITTNEYVNNAIVKEIASEIVNELVKLYAEV